MTLLHQAAQKAVEAHYKELGDAWIAFDGSPGTAKRVNFALGMLGFAIDALVAQMSALQQQPEPVALAEIDRDTDGELLIDWSPGPGRMVTLSLRDDGRLSYAVTWDAERAHGTAQMPALQHQEEPSTAVIPPAPPECETEDEKTAFSFGYWQGLHAARKGQEVPREPDDEEIVRIARSMPMPPWGIGSRREDAVSFARALFAASPSTTRQQEVGSGWIPAPIEPTGEMLVAGWNAYLSDMKGGTERFAITYRAMLAAAPVSTRRQDVDSEWRPIESAPKDGLPLLLATEKGVVVIGKRNKHLHIWVEMDGRETPRQIAYWMPLPAAPSTPEKAGGVSELHRCSAHVAYQHDCPHCVAQNTSEDVAASPIPHPLPAQANDGGEQ